MAKLQVVSLRSRVAAMLGQVAAVIFFFFFYSLLEVG